MSYTINRQRRAQVTAEPGSSAAGLKNLEFYLGYACNRGCRFCFVEKKDRGEFSRPPAFAQISASLYAAAARGFNSLSILGGEPTLYPELLKFIRLAKKMGYVNVVLFSNGIKLADMAFLRRLTEAGLDSVSLNIPSHEKSVFEFLTRDKKGFPLLLKALDNLKRLKVPVSAVCVVNRRNYKGLTGYAAFCAARGVRAVVLQHMKFQGNVNPFTQPDNPDICGLKVKMSACVPYVRKMAEYCLSRGLCPPFLEFLAPCVLGGLESRAMEFSQNELENGEDYLCWHPGCQNAATYEVAYKERVKFPGCSSCVYAQRCRGVDKNYLRVFGSSEFMPVRRAQEPFYGELKGRELELATSSFGQAMAYRPAVKSRRPAK